MLRSMRASGACLLGAEIALLSGWLLDDWSDGLRGERTLAQLRGEEAAPVLEMELLADRLGEVGLVAVPALVVMAFLFVPHERRAGLSAGLRRALVLLACGLACLQLLSSVGWGSVGLIGGSALAFLTLLALPQLHALDSRRRGRHGVLLAWQVVSLLLPLAVGIAVATDLDPLPSLIGYALVRWSVLAWITLGDSKRTAAEFAGRSAAPAS